MSVGVLVADVFVFLVLGKKSNDPTQVLNLCLISRNNCEAIIVFKCLTNCKLFADFTARINADAESRSYFIEEIKIDTSKW